MCVCVFGIIVLNIFVERWFWELKMLTGSLVKLHAWLYSYLCFSLLEKRFLSYVDTSLIPPRHLAICRALKLCFYCNLDRSSTARWIDRESSWTLNSSSTAGGSIELLFLCLYFVSRQLYMSTLCFSTPFSTDVSTPFDTSICQELLKIYILVFRNLVLISSISLDLSAPIHLPNTFFSL